MGLAFRKLIGKSRIYEDNEDEAVILNTMRGREVHEISRLYV